MATTPFNKRAPESRFPKTNNTHFSIFHQFHHLNPPKTTQNTIHTIEIVFRHHILTRHRFSVMFPHTVSGFVSQAETVFSRTVFVFSELSRTETMSALSLLKYLVRNFRFNGLFSCIFIILSTSQQPYTADRRAFTAVLARISSHEPLSLHI